MDMPVWGAYTSVNEYQGKVNAWYTTDRGVTVKSFYHFSGNYTSVSVAHVHAVSYNSIDGSFWIQTGDGQDGYPTCRIDKAVYNSETDEWTVTALAAGDIDSFYKVTGMAFYDDYVIWSGDSSVKTGVWKSKLATYTDSSKYEELDKMDINGTITRTYGITFFSDKYGVVIVGVQNQPYLLISTDKGKTWQYHHILGLPALSTQVGLRLCTVHPRNADGNYLIHINAEGELSSVDWILGKMLLLKIVKP
jgi:hypothetical protein